MFLSIPAAWELTCFFSAKARFPFVGGDFTSRAELPTPRKPSLFGILEAAGKQVYMAVYSEHLGAGLPDLVPGNLGGRPTIWDNTNSI